MKIAFALYDRPDYFAGPIVNLRRLLPMLVARGHDVSAFIIHELGAPSSLAHLQDAGVRCYVTKRTSCTESEVYWLLERLAEVQPQVFVPNVILAGYFAAKWAREAGIVTVGTMRADNGFHWGLVEQFVTGDPAWRLSGMMAVSAELARRISETAEPDFPVAVIPSGVPVPKTPIASGCPPKIAYIGRLEEEQKRISLILASFEASLAARDDMTAIIVGHGGCEHKVRAFVSSSPVCDRVAFLGAVPEAELQTQLQGASFILLLSEFEGTPGALMDAMAGGIVPIVCPTPGGVSELVTDGETGRVVDPTPAAVSQAICEMCSQPEVWANLSRSARSLIESRYSDEQMASNWEAFVKELLERQDTASIPQIPRPKRLRLPASHSDHLQFDPRWHHFWRRLRKRIYQLRW